MENILQTFLHKYGYRGSIIPAARLKDLKHDFKRAAEEAEADHLIMDIYFKNLSFSKPEEMESPGSIVVIAMARLPLKLLSVRSGLDKRIGHI